MIQNAKKTDSTYRFLVLLWCLFAPLTSLIFILTLPGEDSFKLSLKLGAIVGILMMTVSTLSDFQKTRVLFAQIGWKQMAKQKILIPLVFTLIQALIFRSSIFESVVFLSAWVLISHEMSKIHALALECIEHKKWTEWIGFFALLVLMAALYLPIVILIGMSLFDSAVYLIGDHEIAQKFFVTLSAAGLLMDLSYQARLHKLPR